MVDHPSYAALAVLLQSFLGSEALCQDSSLAIPRQLVSVSHCVNFCLQVSQSSVKPGLAGGGREAPVTRGRQAPVTRLAAHCQVDPADAFWYGSVHPRDVVLPTPNAPSHNTSLHVYVHNTRTILLFTCTYVFGCWLLGQTRGPPPSPLQVSFPPTPPAQRNESSSLNRDPSLRFKSQFHQMLHDSFLSIPPYPIPL